MKRFVAFILTICMIVTLMPAVVFADDPVPVYVAYIDSIGYESVASAAAAAVAGDVITMTADSTETVTVAINAGTQTSPVALDLNGHTLTGSGIASVITVNSGKYFVLQDSSEPSTGKITQPTEGTGPTCGGGVYNSGNFTMLSGTISGCKASQGGGVYIIGEYPNRSYFTQSGGSISSCSAVNGGGGVYQGAWVISTFSGGSVVNCSAVQGGGIIVNGSALYLSGGTISDCTATYGGGLYTDGDAQIFCTGGSISGCNAVTGGGVYVSNINSFKISESAIINGNVIKGNPAKANNLFLSDGKYIKLAGTFTGNIGISQPGEPSMNAKFGEGNRTYYNDEAKFIYDNTAIYGQYAQNSNDMVWLATYSYDVTFNKNGHGTAPNKQTIPQGGKVNEPDPLTETGYEFGGWYKENTCTNAWDFANDTVSATTMLYAKWTPITYKLHFDANGGTGSMSDQICNYGIATDINPNTFTREGYHFAGWNTSADGNGVYYPAGVLNDGRVQKTVLNLSSVKDTVITFYAMWTPNTYHIAFYPNGNSETTPLAHYTEDHIYGQNQSLTPNAFTRPGYTFTGWNTNADGTGTAYENLATVTNLTSTNNGTFNLYAQWTPASGVQYKVEHWQQTLNKSSYELKETETLYGTTAATATATAKTYEGFSENTSYGGRKASGTIAGAGSLVLELYYDRLSYTISFDANGRGTAPTSYTDVVYGSKITDTGILTSPEAGYGFVGWYKEPECQNKWNFNTDTITGAATLYAKWVANTYSIGYLLNGGSVATANPESYTVESAAITLNNPTKTGYVFAGWIGTDIASATDIVTIPAGSTGYRNYEAKWTAITYSAVFNANGGEGTMSNQVLTYDVPQELAECKYSRPDYTFTKWNTSADGTGTDYSSQASVKNLSSVAGSEVILYAQWTKPPVNPAPVYYDPDPVDTGNTNKTENKDAEFPFTDVEKGTELYDAVEWAWKNGLTNGTSLTEFSPNGTTDRAQIITFMYRAAGCPKPGDAGKYAGEVHRPAAATCPFTDIEPDSWYYDAVIWAWSVGVTNGTSLTTFSPDVLCSSGMVEDFLERFNGADGSDNWSKDRDDCTRGNAVIMMYDEFK